MYLQGYHDRKQREFLEIVADEWCVKLDTVYNCLGLRICVIGGGGLGVECLGPLARGSCE